MKVTIITASTGPTVIVMMGKTPVINLDHAHNKTAEPVTMEVVEVEKTVGKTPLIILLTRRTTTASATMAMPVKMMTLIPTMKVAVVTATQTLITTKHEGHERTSRSLIEATLCFSHPLKCLSDWNQALWSGGRILMTWTRNSNKEWIVAAMLMISGHHHNLSLVRGGKNAITQEALLLHLL